MFSAVPTPQVTASVLKALELIKTKPEIRKKLWDNTSYLRKELTERGFDIGKSVSPIFPIMVRDNKKGSSGIWSDIIVRKKKTAEQFVYLNKHKQMYKYEQQFSISCVGSLQSQMHS